MPEGPNRIDYQETSDVTEIHAAVQREKPEPSADVTPMPLWLTAVCALATAWAAVYLGIFHGGFNADVYNEYQSSPSMLFPLPAGSGAGGQAPGEVPVSLAQQGKDVFSNCAVCHQASGLGVAGQFPPLVGSDWVQGSEKRLIAILLKGLQGPVNVNGKPFTAATPTMPPWEGALSSKKIAAVASYIRSEWGNKAPEITEAKVNAAKKEFASQNGAWSMAQLLEIPADATLPDPDAKPAAPGAAPTPAGSTPPSSPAPGAAAPATSAAASPAASPAPASVAPAAPAEPAAAAPVASAAPAAGADQIIEGKKNYMTICFVCHQPTGLGIPFVFPPLAKSPYVNGNPERFAAIILKGNIGAFTVDGKPFNSVMPPQEATLTDDKIASVMTYVRASFGNTSGPVSAEVVAAARKKFSEKHDQWTQPDLDAWKDDSAAK